MKNQSIENKEKYAVIVIGGGHAGCEAALAPARMGLPTLLLTQNIETLGQMSCNPAIGGVGKGHLVKEIDALGGMMARAADQAGIHWRILNGSKGPAVHSTRCQADRQLYRMTVRHFLESQANLDIFQQEVADVIIENQKIIGVITQTGLRFYADAVVLTTGTFLGGRIHIGLDNYMGGRAGDPPSNRLSERLRALPFNVGRLKTGTPPRLDGRTINYDILAKQHGDTPMPVFSFMGDASEHPRQVPCHITRTTAQTHAIIRGGLDRSPMYAGVIEGVGPRYCPSIEDKIVRFADKESHQIFLEPEGLFTHEVYPNGISTSLPYDVQLNLVRSMPGLENTRITRPGYAIEYDYFDPRDLLPSLATKYIENLFFAGQINGTTGYEEAAAQGLLAGINAGRFAQNKSAWYPRRDEAYLGVLVDDLITLGTNEPYRMFTSRAEHRLILREDNADLRLTQIGYELGLVDLARWDKFNIKKQQIIQEKNRLENTNIKPEQAPAGVLTQGTKAIDLLRRPDWDYAKIENIIGKSENNLDFAVTQQVEIQAKYAGYIARAALEIDKQKAHEMTELPIDLNYDLVQGLSNEVRQKLARHRPNTLGQAGRISGVTPVSVSLLLVHLKKQNLFVNK